MTLTFSIVLLGKPFIKLENKYMLYANNLLVSLKAKLVVVIKYLIKLWKYDNNEFINSLEWESDKKVELFISEVSKSLPSGIRATIEEKDVKRENEKSC